MLFYFAKRRVISHIIENFLALKIHISLETKVLLDTHGGFRTENRGVLEIKVLQGNIFDMQDVFFF